MHLLRSLKNTENWSCHCCYQKAGCIAYYWSQNLGLEVSFELISCHSLRATPQLHPIIIFLACSKPHSFFHQKQNALFKTFCYGFTFKHTTLNLQKVTFIHRSNPKSSFPPSAPCIGYFTKSMSYSCKREGL